MYAANILGLTPLQLEGRHLETMKRLYGPRFQDGVAGDDDDDSDDDGENPGSKPSKQADKFLQRLSYNI